MKKVVLISILLGLIITVLLTSMTAKLSWGSDAAICPGIPFDITANAKAGFPIKSSASVSALGTCGEVSSKLQANDLVKLLVTPASIANTFIWSLVTLSALYALQKLRLNKI